MSKLFYLFSRYTVLLLILFIKSVSASDYGPQFSKPIRIITDTPSQAPVLHKLEINEEFLHKLERSNLTMPARLSYHARVQIRYIVQEISLKDLNSAMTRWDVLLNEQLMKNHLADIDINELIRYILSESYKNATNDLRYFQNKVKYYNSIKSDIRSHVSELREIVSAYQQEVLAANEAGQVVADKSVKVITCIPTQFSNSFRIKTTWQKYSKDELEAYLEELEQALAGIEDDSQLANIDLQNMLQNQQQIMQTMSNISKALHDAALAVIRKIG